MPVIRRTARAEDDLVDIWIEIAHENPDAADRLLDDGMAELTRIRR